MTLLDAIPPPNRRAIFGRCLDSRLRFVPQVIGGLPSQASPTSFLGSAFSDLQCLCAGLRAGTAPKSE
jgi:hypothetical protein